MNAIKPITDEATIARIVKMKDIDKHSFINIARILDSTVYYVGLAYKRGTTSNIKLVGKLAWMNDLSVEVRNVLLRELAGEEELAAEVIADRITKGTLQNVPGIGKRTILIIAQALSIPYVPEQRSSGKLNASVKLEFTSEEIVTFLKAVVKNTLPTDEFKIGSAVYCTLPDLKIGVMSSPLLVTIEDKRELGDGKALYMVKTGKHTATWIRGENFWSKEQINSELTKLQNEVTA